MPINLITGEEYNIDYQELRADMMNLELFHQEDLQLRYVDEWISTLEKADKITVESYFDPEQQDLLFREMIEAPEVFQTVVNMQGNEMYLHFRVSRIRQTLEILGINEDYAQDFEIEDFKEHNTINWMETVDTVERDDPILIVPFTIGRTYKLLVIDGNHRITTAIRQNRKRIKGIVFDSTALVKNHLLSTQFDLYLYILQNEVVWIGSKYPNNSSDETKLLEEIYFASRKVHVAL